MNHYGKNTDNLTSEEKKLLIIDTLMTEVMDDMTKSTEVDMFKVMTCTQLVVERTKIISQILGLDVDKEDENFDTIEESRFSYKRFLVDMRYNKSKMSEVIHQTMWN